MRSNDYGSFGLGPTMSSVNINDLVRSLRLQFEQSLHNEPVYIGDLAVRLGKTSTGQGGYRYWFICPNCGTRVGKLHVTTQTAACRHCMSVKYPSSRYKGMVENNFVKDIKP